MAVTGNCPGCGKRKLLKKCIKCGTVGCAGNGCGNGWCRVCRGKVKSF